AQYRALMDRARHPWYRDSFALDPWNTARELLILRDDAIATDRSRHRLFESLDSRLNQSGG
uniref:hypothetical protein n=1 Tax=Auritidibacter ignavus TaxID=678932 RepID=UPI0015D5E2BE